MERKEFTAEEVRKTFEILFSKAEPETLNQRQVDVVRLSLVKMLYIIDSCCKVMPGVFKNVIGNDMVANLVLALLTIELNASGLGINISAVEETKPPVANA